MQLIKQQIHTAWHLWLLPCVADCCVVCCILYAWKVAVCLNHIKGKIIIIRPIIITNKYITYQRLDLE